MNVPLRRLVCGVLFVGVVATAAASQSAFEVVSIRPKNPKGPSRPSSRASPVQLEWISATPFDLLVRAFEGQRFQVVGVPAWARTDRFDIRAALSVGAVKRDVPELLRTLLAERFGLKVRYEKRSTPVYEIRIGPLGPKLREVQAVDELTKPYTGDPKVPVFFDRISGLTGDEQREIADRDTYHVITSETAYRYRMLPTGAREMDAARVKLSQLREWLGAVLERPVLDRTGLTGLYQFKMMLPPSLRAPAAPRLGAQMPFEPSGVSVFREVQELGLVLERADVMIDFVVVEQIEKPTIN